MIRPRRLRLRHSIGIVRNDWRNYYNKYLLLELLTCAPVMMTVLPRFSNIKDSADAV